MGRYVWWSLVAGQAALAVWGLVGDFVIWKAGGETVTAYLRRQQAAFWWPVALGLAALVGLMLHLYSWDGPRVPPINGGRNGQP